MIDFVQDSVIQAPSDEAVRRVENEVEQKLPPSYRDFLKIANGARLKNTSVSIGGMKFDIEFFLPIVENYNEHPRGWADISVVTSQLNDRLGSDENATGSDLVPIASVYSGNFLVLDYRHNSVEPQVSIWNHETSKYCEPDATFVAVSFDNFLKNLK